MHPKRLSILGVGLLGGSLGLALRSILTDCEIVGYGHRRATLDKAVEIGAIDKGYDEVGLAVRGADLVVMCTPVGNFAEVLNGISTGCQPGTLVTDVGSTKRSVVKQAQQVLPPGVDFVGSHPMAGSEKRGIDFARADLFHGALCIVTPTDEANPEAVTKLEDFWRLLGMRTKRMSPAEHDRVVARISHLPHVVAAALIAMQEPGGLDLAGKGFMDTTRVAGGDGGLWRDILVDNRDNLRAAIEELQQELGKLASLMEPEKGDQLREWLNEAAKQRQELVRRKLGELTSE